MASQAWMSFLQILERTFARRISILFPLFFFFILRRKDADPGCQKLIQDKLHLTLDICALNLLLMKSDPRVLPRLRREDDVTVLDSVRQTGYQRIIVLKAYAEAVNASDINQLVSSCPDIDLINIKPLGNAEVSVDIYSVSCRECCSYHFLFP